MSVVVLDVVTAQVSVVGIAALAAVALLVGALLAANQLTAPRSAAPSRGGARRAGDEDQRPDTTQAAAVQVWPGESSPKVLVVNRSAGPVYDVRAFVALGRRRPEMVGWVRTLPPTGDEPARIALTPQGRESWIKWQRDERNRRQRVAVECTFRDERRQYWRLDRDGELEAISADEVQEQARRN